MKIYEGKGGRYVIFEKQGTMYEVRLRSGAGETMDKVRCDEYRLAVEYRKAFLKIARQV
ncbi:hypothetical protein HGG76_02605 [Ochrobactrum tritici]|uniref:Uncharacterized protein n=1 Tax=Brucella tritici TaxID=94626 RepID=A0A7X6FNX5_9HYPH|nr:hypothetical protein [Brucella tritici]NKW09156.1 hypothetical protein [Brucella tritici]